MRKNQNFNFPVSAQSKIIGVNDKFGNTGIKKQQGSTIVKYDTLPCDGRTEYRFFEGSAQRNYPLSNVGAQGNQLGVGDTMTVQRAYLSIVTTDPTTGAVLTVVSINTAVHPQVSVAEFSFEIANSMVIKRVPVLSWLPQFNKNAENAVSTSFDFDTQVVIPPLLEFVAGLRVLGVPVVASQFIRLTIEGTGAIISPRATF